MLTTAYHLPLTTVHFPLPTVLLTTTFLLPFPTYHYHLPHTADYSPLTTREARTLAASIAPGGWLFVQSDVLELAEAMREASSHRNPNPYPYP